LTQNFNHLLEVNPMSNSDNSAGTWAEVAGVVNDALLQSAPVVITVAVGPRDVLQIDVPRHSFEWPTPLADFPKDATGLYIASQPAADPSASPSNLDGLLWTLGNNAFAGRPASWLAEGKRVRLGRWPNMPRHMHTMHQMYMLAVLGNAYFTAAELATAAKATEAEAQDLINALSLMQLLKYSAEAPAPILPTPEPAAESKPSLGLFARLRARLGR
jgi:hypothetical protein